MSGAELLGLVGVTNQRHHQQVMLVQWELELLMWKVWVSVGD